MPLPGKTRTSRRVMLSPGVASAGDAAERADARSQQEVGEELASEAELGAGTMRALWRWACHQVQLLPLSCCSRAVHHWSLQSVHRVAWACNHVAAGRRCRVCFPGGKRVVVGTAGVGAGGQREQGGGSAVWRPCGQRGARAAPVRQLGGRHLGAHAQVNLGSMSGCAMSVTTNVRSSEADPICPLAHMLELFRVGQSF